MLTISIPGRPDLTLSHLVLDYNGTIAVDGQLLPEVPALLRDLSQSLTIHILTADTYGNVRTQCAGLPAQIHTFPREGAGACKAEIVSRLGHGVVCMGNGFNDIPMFQLADLSVAVLLDEGFCGKLVAHADIVVKHITDGLALLQKPDRIRADLRN